MTTDDEDKERKDEELPTHGGDLDVRVRKAAASLRAHECASCSPSVSTRLAMGPT